MGALWCVIQTQKWNLHGLTLLVLFSETHLETMSGILLMISMELYGLCIILLGQIRIV